MSGEYFNVEDEGSKLYTEYVKEKRPMSTRKEGNTESDEKLQDIEVQLELAEDRCNTLKGQLDYMKNLYSGKTQKVSRKFSTVPSRRPDSSSASGDSLQFKSTDIKEDKSHYNGPTKNIGNIINGISDTVNRLSDLHLQITDSPKQSSHVTNIEIKPLKTKIVEPVKLSSQSQLKSNTSSKLFKQAKRVFHPPTVLKTLQTNSLLSSRNDLKRYSSSMIHRKKHRYNGTNLVEIYHNKAVKGSDSDHSYQDARGRSKTSRSHVERVDVPKLALHVPQEPVNWESLDQHDQKFNKFNNISNINSLPQPDFRKGDTNNLSQYQLPTIASRMKQVAKCYFNAYNFKAVPFCPATSTSPSHNIGINLQQVMSMMKTKQPIHGISPTLAHNIGLAAERLNSNQGSMMVATTTRTCSSNLRPRSCPLSKIKMNYHHLQEIAKTIPEEEIADGYEENKESPIITNIITGPSGDMEIKTKKTPEWMADPSCTQRCTCISMPGTELQHLVTKYQLNQPPNSSNTNNNLIGSQRYIKPVNRKSRPIRMSLVTKNNGIIRNIKNKNEISDAPPNDADLNITMQGKEKTLKGVLTNLHKEFNNMNSRYEELSKLGEGMSEENIKELESLDKDLTTKEEEITMVMDLYKEVLALKQQVQTLKQKSSQCSIGGQFQRSLSEYNNPKAAFHLTKLLKQIQLYQSHYKKCG